MLHVFTSCDDDTELSLSSVPVHSYRGAGRLVGQLQPSWPLTWGDFTKSYYRHFKPAPDGMALRK